MQVEKSLAAPQLVQTCCPTDRRPAALDAHPDTVLAHDDGFSADTLWDLSAAGSDAVATDHIRDESVCVLGPSHAEIGRLYAELTHRRFQVVDAAQDLFTFKNLRVVIGTWDQLQLSDFELFYNLSITRGAIGLLVAETHDALLRRVLHTAALVNRCQSPTTLPPLPMNAAITLLGSSGTTSVFSRVSGPEALPALTQQVLAGPSSVLALSCHSDGTDARLSDRAILCARADSEAIDLRARPANCDLTGYCHRRHLTRNDARTTGDLISPQRIVARIVLFAACQIARASDSAVHAEHGLLSQMLRNPRIGAVVAPWELTFVSNTDLVQLALPFSAGLTAGDALARFYQSASGALRGCNRYLLFGDPEIRALSPRKSTAPVPPARRTQIPRLAVLRLQSSNSSSPNANGTRLSAWLRSRLTKVSTSRLRNSSGEPRVSDERLASANQALSHLETPGCDRSAYESVLRAIVGHEGSTYVHWLDDLVAFPEHITRPTSCFGCGGTGRLFRLQTRHGTRWLAACSRCDSFYADTPEGSPFIDAKFEVTACNRIEHTLPTETGLAMLLNVRSSLEIRTTWRIDEPFEFSALPPGRSWLWLHALGKDGLISFSRVIDNRPMRRKVS